MTIAAVNGSNSIDGSAVAFPLTTAQAVSSVGGLCGTLPGDLPTVTVTILGPTNFAGTTACVGGAWTFVLSPALRNTPTGIDDGLYVITATQRDLASNVSTAGPADLMLATRSFRVSGSALRALTPGRTSDLALSVDNPYPFAITIQSIDVTFIGSAGCNGPANFAIDRPFSGPLTVPPGITVLSSTQAPRIKMLNLATNQNGCKGAPLTLSFTGLAIRP